MNKYIKNKSRKKYKKLKFNVLKNTNSNNDSINIRHQQETIKKI